MRQDSKPKVGILTTFYEMNSAYSLSTVVESQLISLRRHGYDTVLFVHDNFIDDHKVPDGVEVRKVVPRFHLVDYSATNDIADDLEHQVAEIHDALKQHMQDVDIMIEHDLIFQGWFLPYCIAIHKLSRETDVKWFHWIHSFPRINRHEKYPLSLMSTLPQNSKLVYLNNHDIVDAAESYGIFPRDVRVIHNPLDPRQFWKPESFVRQLIDKYDLLSADFMQIYPVSTPRMVSGKGLHTLIEIFAALKKEGKKVRLVVCNAHANAEREKAEIDKVLSFANQRGLTATEIIFTSTEGQEYEQGVPREVVSDLLRLSNLFVFPSTSENCSLILLEAMLSGCILVLNKDVPSMREFGKDNALYFRFGSIHQNIEYKDRDNYMRDVALHIISQLSTNSALKAKGTVMKQFNWDAIFKNQIEPLFYEND